MSFQAAYDYTDRAAEMIEETQEVRIIDKVRRGRLAALAAHKAKFAESENVVSIFDREMAVRAATPVFHSRRTAMNERKAAREELGVLVLTNPIAA